MLVRTRSVCSPSGTFAGIASLVDDGMDPVFVEPSSQCGDGVVDPTNEECDDGNTFSQDGCSNCLTDIGFLCTG